MGLPLYTLRMLGKAFIVCRPRGTPGSGTRSMACTTVRVKHPGGVVRDSV
jgi:hypothetical protein